MITQSELQNLINLKQEGSYWDFKREWYSNKNDLLLDILCFANNLVNRDCYIIIGVDEETNYAIKDVSQDVNRRNTQNINDFLKDKHFAGGIRPVVAVTSLQIDGKCIDIIVIYNSNMTPFYITKKYQAVNPYHIYTRIQDTNTDVNSSADINHVEYLWRKRFRLDETPLEKMTEYLTHKGCWQDSPLEIEDARFYIYSPEYKIVSVADNRDGYEIYHFTQPDPRPHWETVYLYYHQTVMASFSRIIMDGARWSTIAPDSSCLFKRNQYPQLEYTVYYSYTKGTLSYILHDFFLGENRNYYGYNRFLEVVLVFECQEEKDEFEEFVLNNLNMFERIYNEQEDPYLMPVQKYDMDIFKREYKAGVTLKIMLDKYRTSLSN